jgi:hypothetical protein
MPTAVLRVKPDAAEPSGSLDSLERRPYPMSARIVGLGANILLLAGSGFGDLDQFRRAAGYVNGVPAFETYARSIGTAVPRSQV